MVVLTPHVWVVLAFAFALVHVKVVCFWTVVGFTHALAGMMVKSVVLFACRMVFTCTMASVVVVVVSWVAFHYTFAFASTGRLVEELVVGTSLVVTALATTGLIVIVLSGTTTLDVPALTLA